MPAGRHLQRFRITEFGGLWTAGAQTLMPANKAQIMSGCHPQVGGGLRAFHKVSATIPGTGLLRGAAETVVGFSVTTKAAETDTSAPTLFAVTVDGYNGAHFTGGATQVWTTPDKAALDITGDIDLRAYVILDDYTPGGLNIFLSNLNTATFSGYEFRINNAGNLVLVWGNGAASLTMTSTAVVPTADDTKVWLRVTMDVDNGAGSRVANFYTSVDGVTWTALGATVTTAGVTAITASSLALSVGGRADGSFVMSGQLIRAEVRSGIGGTEVASPDFGTYPVGATSVTDAQANVFTAGAAGSIIRTTYTFPGDWQLWRWESDEVTTSWSRSSAATFAGGTADLLTPPSVQPQFVRSGSGGGFLTDYVSISLRENAGTLAGVYSINPDDGTVVRNLSIGDDRWGPIGLVDHQSRIVVGYQDRIYYTAPGESDFVAVGAGFIRLNSEGFYLTPGNDVHEGAMVAWMLAIPPGDFVVATRDGRIFNIQGDLGDPSVRELGRWTTMQAHEPTTTPSGIFFVLPNQGIAALGLDGSVSVISHDILPSLWNLSGAALGLGQLAGTERFLFAPNMHEDADHRNGALVYDMDTKAWFTSTHETEHVIRNPQFMQPDNNPRDSGIWVIPSTSPQGSTSNFAFQIRTGGSDMAGVTEQRNSTWEYESATLREPAHGYLDVHEAVIPVYAWNGSSTLSVTVGATTRVLNLPAGRSIQTLGFRERGTSLSIKVLAKSNDPLVEAPMLEEIDVGWKDGPPL